MKRCLIAHYRDGRVVTVDGDFPAREMTLEDLERQGWRTVLKLEIPGAACLLAFIERDSMLDRLSWEPSRHVSADQDFEATIDDLREKRSGNQSRPAHIAYAEEVRP